MNGNIDIARARYAAFGRGDVGAVLATRASGVHLTEAEGGPYGGLSIGPAAVLEHVFMQIGGDWERYAAVPHATGRSFRAPFAHVWKFRDGKAVSSRQLTDTALHQRPLQRG